MEFGRHETDREKLLHELEQLEKRLAGGPRQAQQTQQQEALLRRIQEKEAQLQVRMGSRPPGGRSVESRCRLVAVCVCVCVCGL